MKVKILNVTEGELTRALIKEGKGFKLPSIHEDWRFNFNKHANKHNSRTYVLVKEDTPTVIEGCMIFEMKEGVIPYMSFLEVAPHNKGDKKEYDYVAGCLIAYACKLSFIHGKEHHNGALIFEVHELNKDEEIKLKALYSKKYRAYEFGGKMEIYGDDCKKLIKEYLERS